MVWVTSPGPGKCVHCLAEVAERNWDHVFPRSWYPDSTPPNIEKWQIPSCIPCNTDYGKMENDLRDLVGLCLDPNNPASRSIVEATMRSLDPTRGRDPEDAERRLMRARRLMRKMLPGTEIQQENVYPRITPHEDAPPEDRMGILIPDQYWPRMAHKIVRGMFFIHEGKFIEPPYVIDFYPPVEANVNLFEQVLNKFGATYDRGPGLEVRRAITVDEELSSIFKITFWEQYVVLATITRN